jgi:hypothetical protein
MAQKLIIDFLHDWVRNKKLREDVLHREEDGMKDYGLDGPQYNVLRKFDQQKIVEKIAKELGLDLEDLREAVYGTPGVAPAAGAAAYDQGRTHIRRVVPAVISVNTSSEVVLMGHGFKSDKAKVTVEFITGPPANPTIKSATVNWIKCGVDIWQRVAVSVTLDATGDWDARAHNDDEGDPPGSGNWKWSQPSGRVHVVA